MVFWGTTITLAIDTLYAYSVKSKYNVNDSYRTVWSAFKYTGRNLTSLMKFPKLINGWLECMRGGRNRIEKRKVGMGRLFGAQACNRKILETRILEYK